MPSILVVGLGLIGGSAGMALRRRGWRVAYLDPHVSLDDARRVGAADERVDSIVDADVVLLATPVDVAIEQLRDLQFLGSSVPRSPSEDGHPRNSAELVITSTCSVMRALRDAARETFIAGHPMAGSEASGLAAANAELFVDKRWFLDAEHELVDVLVRDCGAIVERVDAAEHDAAVALTSHLPQVLSTALAAYLHDREDLLRFAGTGLQTFLRLAGSDASVWAPVLEANRDQLAPHADAIAALVQQIIEGDPRDAFAKAQATWRALAAPRR